MTSCKRKFWNEHGRLQLYLSLCHSVLLLAFMQSNASLRTDDLDRMSSEEQDDRRGQEEEQDNEADQEDRQVSTRQHLATK